MSVFSWFDTSDLPQNSIKKQIIDQSGHFFGGSVIYLVFMLSLINITYWPLLVMAGLIYGLLSITKTQFTNKTANKLYFTTLIAISIILMPLLLVTGYNIMWLVGLFSGLAIGFGREFYQHASLKLSATSIMDAVFFGIGAMAMTLFFV